MKRYALVRGLNCTAEIVGRYLPSNYRVLWSGPFSDGALTDPVVVIGGEDRHGFTLDGYVLPRLGSGLLAAREIDLSHPVMRLVPEQPAVPADFDRWMASVDRAVEALAGVSVSDLPDCCYRDWFDDGLSPREAARLALENASL